MIVVVVVCFVCLISFLFLWVVVVVCLFLSLVRSVLELFERWPTEDIVSMKPVITCTTLAWNQTYVPICTFSLHTSVLLLLLHCHTSVAKNRVWDWANLHTSADVTLPLFWTRLFISVDTITRLNISAYFSTRKETFFFLNLVSYFSR